MRETHNCLKDLQSSEISEFTVSLLPADAWESYWKLACPHSRRALTTYSDYSLFLLAQMQKAGNGVGSGNQDDLLPLLIR